MAGRAPRGRRRGGRSGREGASLVGADVAGDRAGRGADADRARGPAAIAGAQTGAGALSGRRTLGTPPRRGGRTPRRRACAGARDRGARRRRLGPRRARLSLSPHRAAARWLADPRSEEHTSELQSLMRISYAVFCFKKKKNKINNIIYIYTCLVGGIQRDRNTSLYNIYHYKYLNKPSTQTILCHIYIPNTSLIRPLYHKTRRLCTNT